MLTAIRTKIVGPGLSQISPMILLALYLGLSPVYRFWVVGEVELRILKGAVLVAGLGAVALTAWLRGDLRLPSEPLGPVGFGALFVLSVPGLVQAAQAELVLQFLVDIAFAAGMLWCFYHLAIQGRDINKVLSGALIILAAFAAIHLAVALAADPDRSGVCDWAPSNQSAFGAHYGAWSVSMALFLPIAVLLPLSAKEIGRRWTVPMASVLACILLGSQFVSGGRAGIIAVVVSVLALTLFRSARVLALSIIAVSIVVGVVLFDDSCSRHLKLDRLSGLTGSSTAEASGLDALGTGRLAGYRVAIKEIVERPLLGHGLGQVVVEGVHRPTVEIHSLWLKWAAYCGVLAPLWFAVMIAVIGLRGLRLLRGSRKKPEGCDRTGVLLLTLFGGLVASLLQPNALIGSMQYTALWWAAAGLLLGNYAAHKSEDRQA